MVLHWLVCCSKRAIIYTATIFASSHEHMVNEGLNAITVTFKSQHKQWLISNRTHPDIYMRERAKILRNIRDRASLLFYFI